VNESELSEPIEDHDRGLQFDLPTILHRRSLLKWMGGAGLAAIGASMVVTSSRVAFAAAAAVIPEETAGPYPGDGSNGPNIFTQSGIVRSDIRSSFGTSTTTALGVPTTVTLTVTDLDTGNTAAHGLAVYLWHCNRDGLYSMYGQGITNENYLRGVQVTDANGQVTFTTIFPACYGGRWPHMHFEVYPSVASATSSANKIATSQIALPKAICDQVFATTGYSQSVTNLAQTSLSTDNVFSDGVSLETPTYSGDVTNGIALAMDVAVHANGAGAVSTLGDTTITPTASPTTIGVTSAFVPLASPRRLLDTRAATLTGYSGSKPAAGATVELQVLGREGVPASGVTAVVVNVTATEAAAAGFVTVWPDGDRPTASNLNLEVVGQTRPNLVTVPVGSDGSVRIFTQTGAHLVADVFGYFTPASTSRSGRLRTVTPGRLLDTRAATITGYSGSKPTAGSTVPVSVLGAQGVPTSGVSAVVMNVTVTEATAAGYVTAWPEGTRPATSNINVDAVGGTTANQVVIPVGADGSIRLFTQGGAHLIADVTGWYTDDTAEAGTAGLFVPVSPYRVVDSRSGGKFDAGATVTLLAAATGTAAAGKSGLAMNVTVTETSAPGFVTVWPEATRPTASSLNATAIGQTLANHVITAVGGDGGVRLFTQTGTHFVVDVSGWYV
jgi:protocatechuate 3,4-dioxygenase beta subunit